MSCMFCKDLKGELIYGNDGTFQITKRSMFEDGEETVQPIVNYYAFDRVFDFDVEIDDHFVIAYCPMCGEKL